MWQLPKMCYNPEVYIAVEKGGFSSILLFYKVFSLLRHAARACTTELEFSDCIIGILKAEFHLHRHSLW